jgi:hypothetical protein
MGLQLSHASADTGMMRCFQCQSFWIDVMNPHAFFSIEAMVACEFVRPSSCSVIRD